MFAESLRRVSYLLFKFCFPYRRALALKRLAEK